MGLSLEEALGNGWRQAVHADDGVEVFKDWQEAVVEGKEFEREFRLRTPQGQVHWVHVRSAAKRDNRGVTGYVGMMTDITDRKNSEEERQRMEIQLRHAQKMESIGQLAAGIAHEINTPTQFIGDNTRFIRDSFGDLKPLLDAQTRLLAAARVGPVPAGLLVEVETAARNADVDYLSEEIPKALGQSLDGIERVTNIVRAMKEFSHPGATEKTALDLNRAIESTLTVCCSEWKYVADVASDFDAGLPPVPVLPGEFNQVVLNIIINATHAIADVVGDGSNGKGKITVSTRRDGDWVEVRIGDSGTGIPEHARQRVFDPFFTTKGVGKGTGQGLAIAHSVVVEKHGGTIHFETETGKGTTFIIRLPLTSQAASTERKAA
jgi:signal transduction histidine kinase